MDQGTMLPIYRHEEEVSQQELADRVSEILGRRISRSSISLIENARIIPKREEAEAIAEAMARNPADIWPRRLLRVIYGLDR